MVQSPGRRHPFVALDRDQLDGMLRSVFPGLELELFEPVSGGRCNTNYKVVLRGEPQPFFLRVYSRGREVAEKELALYRLLKGRVPVPEAVFARTPEREHGLPYAVFTWIPMPTLDQVLPSLDSGQAKLLGRSTGATLAEIGSVRFEAAGDLAGDLSIRSWPNDGEGTFLSFVRGCLFEGRAGERLGPERRDAVWELATREAGRLRDEDGSCRLVHSDFNPTNLLVRLDAGEPSIGAVVDWEFAHSGSPLMDFGNLLRDHRRLPAPFVDGFLDGYQLKMGRLPADWLARAKLVDLTAHLEFLQSAEDRGDIHTLALATIERTLSHWYTYFPWP